MKLKTINILTIVLSTIFVIAVAFCSFTPMGVELKNWYKTTMNKTELNTKYESRKQAEDTARAMMASYKADVSQWMQYKDSDNAEKQGWSEQAKLRANRTASIYNEFIRKNSFLWKSNVPADIDNQLEILQ